MDSVLGVESAERTYIQDCYSEGKGVQLERVHNFDHIGTDLVYQGVAGELESGHRRTFIPIIRAQRLLEVYQLIHDIFPLQNHHNVLGLDVSVGQSDILQVSQYPHHLAHKIHHFFQREPFVPNLPPLDVLPQILLVIPHEDQHVPLSIALDFLFNAN